MNDKSVIIKKWCSFREHDINTAAFHADDDQGRFVASECQNALWAYNGRTPAIIKGFICLKCGLKR